MRRRVPPPLVAGPPCGQPGDMSGDAVPKPPEPEALHSEELLRGAREVRILHGGDAYRLQVTSSGKLILTK